MWSTTNLFYLGRNEKKAASLSVEKPRFKTYNQPDYRYIRSVFTLSIQNIRNTSIILSCTPLPFRTASIGLCMDFMVSKVTPMLPTVVASWLDVLWVLTHSCYTRETVEREKPSGAAVLDILKLMRLAPTTVPCSKAFKSFVLPIHPLNGTHTQSMFHLSQGLKILL
jgi:hypothetical protein